VLIHLALAQTETTLEVIDLLKAGIVLRQAEELSRGLELLASKLPDR
jgi:hypothetical protein